MKGICEELCPEQEVKLRVKENLLHFYELKKGQKSEPGILVKEFSRSAAGKKTLKPKDLRTEKCLHKAVYYLLTDIILDKRKPYKFVYDFIFDRFRSIRQEMVIQDYGAEQTIGLLEPIIMFLAYSRYRLCEEVISNFDSKICDQHLQESLKRVLCCYDELSVNELNERKLSSRCFIEAMYQLFNLGSTEALGRAILLPLEIRKNEIFALTFSIAMNRYQGNICRVLNDIKRLPHTLCAISSLKLPILRRNLLMIFAHGYSSKQLLVPLDYICKISLHSDCSNLLAECKHYGLKSDDSKHLKFIKTDFQLEASLPSPVHEMFVEEKLHKIYLPEVLLLRRF